MFEHRSKPVIPRVAFVRRMLTWLLITLVLLSLSLLAGIMGYHFLENMKWIDALENAAMILGGMGPVDALHTNGGKIFASVYAIYCGIFLIACGGVLLVPVFHRVLYYFHAEKA